jgi:hypothetical protein
MIQTKRISGKRLVIVGGLIILGLAICAREFGVYFLHGMNVDPDTSTRP